MTISKHDLAQFDDAYVDSLSDGQRHKLCCRLRDDLIEAYDRLNQNPSNSSRPPSSQPPWFFPADAAKDEVEDKESGEVEELLKDESDDSLTCDELSEIEEQTTPDKPSKDPKRKAGKQKGAQGYGRTQQLPVTGIKIHRASICSGCSEKLDEDAHFVARFGHYVLDIEKKSETCVGLQVTNTKHLYGDTSCQCGHVTRTKPYRCPKESDWNVELTQWHLVGPLLMALICCLDKRFRMSRRRIKEFLHDWLGIELAVGTINQCIHEMGRAVAPLETQLIEEVSQSGLMHADETSWKERGQPLWLWVLSSITTTVYVIGKRDITTLEKILAESFGGWLMTDGYGAYRWYKKRLRCWAHLKRKAQGLSESLNKEARIFGKRTLNVLITLIKAIHRVREGPKENLVLKYQELLDQFRVLCELFRGAKHEKTRKLAREFLNDWDAIFRILTHPHLPLTNNEAERALRHWVISRRICYGTQNSQGSRVFALLASLIDTCRKRAISPWDYLATVIHERRRGHEAPPIPAPIPA